MAPGGIASQGVGSASPVCNVLGSQGARLLGGCCEPCGLSALLGWPCKGLGQEGDPGGAGHSLGWISLRASGCGGRGAARAGQPQTRLSGMAHIRRACSVQGRCPPWHPQPSSITGLLSWSLGPAVRIMNLHELIM